MTTENLQRAIELKREIDTYNAFIGLFTPRSFEESQTDMPSMPRVVISAEYVPGTTDADGNIAAGHWQIQPNQGSMAMYGNVLALMNDLVASELSTIGQSLIGALNGKITEAQAEFDTL